MRLQFHYIFGFTCIGRTEGGTRESMRQREGGEIKKVTETVSGVGGYSYIIRTFGFIPSERAAEGIHELSCWLYTLQN